MTTRTEQRLVAVYLQLAGTTHRYYGIGTGVVPHWSGEEEVGQSAGKEDFIVVDDSDQSVH